MQSISIDLPEDVPPELAREIGRLTDRHNAAIKAYTEWRELLDHGTDEAIVARARAECLEPNAPFVLASTYEPGDQSVYTWEIQQLCWVVPRALRYHPRRPVAMRGGRRILIRKYSLTAHGDNPNGWALRVFDRAVRAHKQTILNAKDRVAYLYGIAERVADKHRAVTAAFWDRACGARNFADEHGRYILLCGRHSYVTHSEYANIERLQTIIRKTERLDERLALLRASKRY